MNNDEIKKQREGIGIKRDMANNTFIKLFQSNQNQEKQQEMQSVQYADQNIDDSSINENGEDQIQIISQRSNFYSI